MKLLAELTRRYVIRVAGLDRVSAWLVVKVAATLPSVFDPSPDPTSHPHLPLRACT